MSEDELRKPGSAETGSGSTCKGPAVTPMPPAVSVRSPLLRLSQAGSPPAPAQQRRLCPQTRGASRWHL